MPVSSAIPDQLTRYSGAAGDIDDELVRIGGEVQDALDAFAARASDVPVLVEPLGREVRAMAAVAADLDTWVHRVGFAFRKAGEGMDLLGWLWDLVHGALFNPTGAQPDWTDGQVTEALETLLGLDPARPPGSIVQPLVSPDLVKAFVSSLTPAQLDDLAAQHPELVGPVDGMPHELRYTANRTLIDRTLVQARLDGDAELVETLEGLAGADRQFLLFDPAGDGRAAEVFGDLTTAEDVTVFVPGIMNALADFSGTHDNAQNIYDEAQMRDPSGSHVTIAWLGYDTPELDGATYPWAAHEFAPLLRQLWDGLALPDAVNTTVVAHSYGSLLAATALRDGYEGIDNFVVIGSPGLEADDLDDLDLAAGTQFVAARAPFDTIVGSTESFGRDPSDPRFGGIRLATGIGPDGYVTRHSSYTTEGSESLRNLANVAVGNLEGITTIEPTTADGVIGALDDIHDIIIEGPVDGVQWLDEGLDEAFNTGIDTVQDYVPLGPLQGPIDDLQGAFETVDHYLDSLIDSVQRVHSPDFLGDVLGDWFAVDGPGRLLDVAGDVIEFGVDVNLATADVALDMIEFGVDVNLATADVALDAAGYLIDTGLAAIEFGVDVNLATAGYVIDTAGDVIDTAGDVIDSAGDALDSAADTAADAADSAYDNTLGRLPLL